MHLFTVQCPALMNGTLQCPNGATTGVFEDTCTFSCNAGYELQGSISGTCLADQSWSGGLPVCELLNCPNITGMLPSGSILSSLCDEIQYQSQCTLSCDEGFTGDDVTYLCNVTNDPNMVNWVPIGGVDVMCERGLFACQALWLIWCTHIVYFYVDNIYNSFEKATGLIRIIGSSFSLAI